MSTAIDVPDETRADPPGAGDGRPAGSLRGLDLALPGRLALAVVGGLCVWLTFPDANVPALGPVGVALLSAAILGTRPRTAAILGLVGGLACFVPTLSWSGIFVGPVPWLALATVEALYVAAMCAIVAAIHRRLLRRPPTAARDALVALAVPLGWVAQEWLRGSWPFGGFPWARLAFGQTDGPLLRLAALGGAPLVTFAVAAIGAALHLLVVTRWTRPELLRYGAAPAAALALVLLAVTATPVPTDGTPTPLTLVQGNTPREGLDFNAERRAVLDNHVRGTQRAAERDGTPPAAYLWPENSSDIDPLRNADAKAQVQRAVDAAGAPVLVGAILDEPAPEVSNASLLYRPGEDAPSQQYVKQHPVPFAEYVPYRSFFRLFSDKVDLVRVGFARGRGSAAMPVQTPGGATVDLVPSICFEVAYDGLVREAVTQHPDRESVLVVQTNNATFGRTAESTQQLAISRLRAVEHGRAVAHVSTVGVSAFIAPDGSLSGRTELFTAAQVRGEPVARAGRTIADRVGPLPEVLAGLGLVALWFAGRGGPRRRLGRNATRPTPPTDREKDRLRA